ncbi:putative methyltransferase [Novymonas esmeraldas]|uniref:Methyltransferase n=1 Tax=Novymonas esmeraldas TaxID=1808958 RepID=A0AAW0EL32_9TRYP
MDRLPPIASAFRSVEYTFPRSLVLFLQGAPPKTVLSAFQADCEHRDLVWCGAEAQSLAVDWFVRHPVARKFPPRRCMVRAFLKSYITSVEEQYMADCAVSSASGDDPVRMELMEEYIRVSVSSDANEQDWCFKTFYNPHVGASETACSVAMAPTPPALLSATHTQPPARLHRLSPGSSSHEASVRDVGSASTVASRSSHGEHPSDTSPSAAAPTTSVSAEEQETSVRLPSPSGRPPPPPPPLLSSSSTGAMEQFSAIRVSTEQFRSVGLSLWPAAFVLVQLLAQELRGETHLLSDVLGLPRAVSGRRHFHIPAAPSPSLQPTAPRGLHRPGPLSPVAGRGTHGSTANASASASHPESGQLRILELGAGVALTPVYLHHMAEYRRHVASFVATDYQDTIVENMRFNMLENGIRPVADLVAARRGLEGDAVQPFHQAALLDWCNHDVNEGIFLEDEVDVVLAADCIYDVDAIPALVDTIHLALTTRSAASYTGGSGAGAGATAAALKQRCCVVVQTHRQASTMQKFFTAVRAFGQVRSYTLVRQPAGTLRLSDDNSGVDGGCVPLGGWDRQSLLLSPDRVVCALVPDVVLEDGSMRHAGQRRYSGSSPCATAARRASDGAPGVAGVGKGGVRTPFQSSWSNNSADSHASTSRSAASAAVVEAADALLADEMIGPFHTTMVGLIGVHVITVLPHDGARGGGDS